MVIPKPCLIDKINLQIQTTDLTPTPLKLKKSKKTIMAWQIMLLQKLIV